MGDGASGVDVDIGCGFVLRDACREHPPSPGDEQNCGSQQAEFRGAEIVCLEGAEGSSERDSLVHGSVVFIYGIGFVW
jgi:hypothetical protein